MDKGHLDMSAISAAGARTAPPVSTPTKNDTPLEPQKAAPAIAPYKASAGGRIGTGAGALGGAVLGGGVGMLVFGGLTLMGGVGGALTGSIIGMGFGALVGGVMGGVGIYSMNKDNYLTTANASRDETIGTSTLGYAREQIAKFDHNGDGAIQIDNATGLPSKDERVRGESNQFQQWRSVSAATIWNDADVDPADRKVTDIELARLMSNYDADKSGSLTTIEKEAFSDAHPMQFDAWRK